MAAHPGGHKPLHKFRLPPFGDGHSVAASPTGTFSTSTATAAEEGLNRTGNLSPVSPEALARVQVTPTD